MKIILHSAVTTHPPCKYQYIKDNVSTYLLKFSSDLMSFLDLTSTSSSGRLVENSPLTSR